MPATHEANAREIAVPSCAASYRCAGRARACLANVFAWPSEFRAAHDNLPTSIYKVTKTGIKCSMTLACVSGIVTNGAAASSSNGNRRFRERRIASIRIDQKRLNIWFPQGRRAARRPEEATDDGICR